MKINYRNISLSISFILLSFISYGQNLTFDKIDDLANSKYKEILDSENIDKVLIYSDGCIGCERISLTECECNLGFKITYLLWKESEIYKIQKIDCCRIYKPEQIKFDDLWNYLNSNSKTLFNSKYKTEFETDHYSFTDIKLIEKNTVLESNIKSYFFDESNSYFKENKNQPMNVFIKKVAVKIKEFENKRN